MGNVTAVWEDSSSSRMAIEAGEQALFLSVFDLPDLIAQLTNIAIEAEVLP